MDPLTYIQLKCSNLLEQDGEIVTFLDNTAAQLLLKQTKDLSLVASTPQIWSQNRAQLPHFLAQILPPNF